MFGEAVRLEGICMSFGSKEILRNISFSVLQGESVVVAGTSGCGKTTLLRIISGLQKPTTGLCSVPQQQGGIQYVPQESSLFPWRNVKANISSGLEFMRISKDRMRESVKKYVRIVGLEGYEDYKPHQLSGGMKQRVSLARALAVEPRIILMDEPFNSLDPASRKEIQTKTRSICRQLEIALVFVTHDVEEALAIADRIFVLSSYPARIVKEIKVSEVSSCSDSKQVKDELYNALQSCPNGYR